MTKSKQWAYIHQQAYGDIPTVEVRDEGTLEALFENSPWAIAEKDSAFTIYEDNPLNKEDSLSLQRGEVDEHLGLYPKL